MTFPKVVQKKNDYITKLPFVIQKCIMKTTMSIFALDIHKSKPHDTRITRLNGFNNVLL
jgi:hypothetical protein